jgi:hypothetical protein
VPKRRFPLSRRPTKRPKPTRSLWRLLKRRGWRRADVLFTTVPVLVSGRVFHRFLAGPATDSAAEEELRTSLSASLSNED